jgi:DNA repair protein RadD
MNLRTYQHQAVEQIRQAYRQGHRSVLFVLPTGGGKTVVFSHIAEQAAGRGNRICVLVHRQELLRQASDSLTSLGVRHGLIAASRSMNLAAPVQVASVQTLARRLHKLPAGLFQLLVIDEAHHSNAGTWAKVLQHFASARVLGVTATPCRSDGRGLGEWYSAMVLGPTPAELTEQGFLAAARVLAPPGPSLVGLRRRMGDYDLNQAGQILQAGQAMGDCLAHYRRYLDGQTAIAFCCSIAHAEAVAELFNQHGIAAASIDGTMDGPTREQLLDDLGAGRLKVLTSCQLIGEGVDVPSVAGCILLRPTQSVSLHLQMIGRCLRPQPGKTAVILDHVGNTQRIGHHLEDREWTLDGTPKRDREKAPSVKVCPKCFSAMPSAARECPDCGHEFVVERRELVHVDGELEEVQRHGQVKVGSYVTVDDRDLAPKYPGTWRVYRFGQLAADEHAPITKDMDFVDHAFITKDFDGNPPDHGNWLRVEKLRIDAGSARREQANATTLQDLIQVGQRRNMKNPVGWARHVLAARETKGHWARVS